MVDEIISKTTMLDLPVDVLRMFPPFLSHAEREQFALACRHFRDAESEAGKRRFDKVVMRTSIVVGLMVNGRKINREIKLNEGQQKIVQYMRNASTDLLIIDGHFGEENRQDILSILKTVMFKQLNYYVIEATEYDEQMIANILIGKNLSRSKIYFDICQKEGDATFSRYFLSTLPNISKFKLRWWCDDGKRRNLHRDSVIDDSTLISMMSSIQFLDLTVICTNVTAMGLLQVHQIVANSTTKRVVTILVDEPVYMDFQKAMYGQLRPLESTGWHIITEKLSLMYMPCGNYDSNQTLVELDIQTLE